MYSWFFSYWRKYISNLNFVHREKKISLIQWNEYIEYFLIELIKYLLTTMKTSILIQWNVTLNRNDKILSISN